MHSFSYLQEDFPTPLWLPLVSNQPTQNFESGRLIYLQETQATSFYYLKEGKVKSFILSQGGNQRILHVYHQGSIFGEVSFFDELPRVSSAQALEDCKVVSIDRKLVEQQFAQEPKLAISMMKYLARTVRLLSNQVDDMAFRPAPKRVARHLLYYRNQENQVEATQEEIATSISVSRITVSRILGDFTEKGWVLVHYGSIQVINPEALELFLEH